MELSAVEFTGDWGVNVTSALGENTKTRQQALNDNNVQYNVALGMFLDANETQAQADLPHYEVMVWLSYSYNVYPVGIDTSSLDKDQYIVNGTRFFLYHGNNTQGQTVCSWLPENNLTHTSGDFSPLVHYLWQFNFMPQNIYLGTIQFGTETFHATSEVSFSAGNYSLSISHDENLQVPKLEAPKLVKIPDQVPTMARFESGVSPGALHRPCLMAFLILSTLLVLHC
ncbi:uncharacterized protein A1O9_03788 [Exophiala aquamarina CBS 119918]|uniref:Uncharacterized protein n=1 Tax=Exophiala aquamarina CBS 119918 TaxID=1182545 RepID=A0A072PTT8_9EURO|nr:uncharacterized protein A1O9_03788 [Exophiala aquamarina CBS 119918]KEF58945.1 hypothetical protein A1O9_03788 [Exophiala aquamarina CBS 119918]